MFNLLRHYLLSIGDKEYSELSCQFEIDSGFNNQVKRAIFHLRNQSEESYNAMQENDFIRFSVKDETGFPMAYEGLLVNKDRVLDSDGTMISKIFAWSGGTIYQKEKVSITFEVGSTGTQVLDWLQKRMAPFSIELSNEAQQAVNEMKYTNGKTFFGPLPAVLADFARELEQKFTFDNNSFLIGVREDKTHKVSAELMNLVDSPNVTIEGTEIVTPIIATLRVGDIIDLESKYFSYASSEAAVVSQKQRAGSGLYHVMNFTHKGDTHDREWFSYLNLLVKHA